MASKDNPEDDIYGSSPDPYLDANGVLKNKLGLDSRVELSKAESNYTGIRSDELGRSPPSGQFDLDHLKKIHHHLFQDVYSWAGKTRTVNIHKGGNPFAYTPYIENESKKLFKGLAEENNLKGLDAERFSDRAGHYLGEINAIHPFREGNGRAQRAFISQLSEEAGYRVSWKGITREEMVQGSIESFNGDSKKLSQLILDNLDKNVSPGKGEFDSDKTNSQLNELKKIDPVAYGAIVAIKTTAQEFASQITTDKESQAKITDQVTQRALNAHQQGKSLANLAENYGSKAESPKNIEPER